MKRIQWILIVGLLVCLGVPRATFGQISSSAIVGVVQDATEAVIAGAEVTVTNVETGITRARESGPSGLYRVGELQPGTYQITVSMAGFNREVRREIVLEVGRELTLNFTLQVGAVEQEVVVTGEAPVVETTISSVSTNVSQEQLRELPLNGRSFADLVTLNPGAVTPHIGQGRGANYGFAPQLSVAGARTDANSFRLDGTDLMDTRNQNPGSAAGVQLGVDTIREFQVVTTNGKAEYGRNAGAVVNAVSRSGTNEWHGSAFEFVRNNRMDARQFEDPGDVPPFKRNQFGATIGGPIRRDQTFFFVGFEGLRQRLNDTNVWRVPTAEGRQGIGLLDPGETVDPRVVPYINLYPLPSPGGRDFGDGTAELFEDRSQPTSENFLSGRIDHHISENDFLFGRYTISRANTTRVDNRLLSSAATSTSKQILTLQEDHIFGPNLLNTFRLGFSRSLGNVTPTQVEGVPESLGFAPGVPLGTISADNLEHLGPNGIGIVDDVQNSFQFENNLSYTSGPHTVKFGAMAQRFQWNTDNPAFWQGDYNFESLEGFLRAGKGTGTDATYRLPESSTNRGVRTWLLAFFAQDDYRVSPSLTLNLGFRWEFTTGMTEVNDKVTYLGADVYTATLDDLILGQLWQNHIKNFEPRLGFNWALGQDQMTALSGGFGIFHNQILHNSFVSFRSQLPFNFRASAANVDVSGFFPDIEAAIRDQNVQFRNTRHFDFENFKTPTFYRYNLTLQRQLPGEMALRIGYVGAIGRHLARRSAYNDYPIPVERDGALFFPSASEVAQRPNPNFNRIEWMSSDVNSIYSSLAVNLQKRFSRGLTFQTSYTFSKSIDDYSQSETNFTGETGARGSYGQDRTLERARSVYNVPHVLVFNGIYQLPFGVGKPYMNTGGIADAILGGWQIGGIVTLQQGLPFTVGSRIRDRRPTYLFSANRPNLNPGVDVNKLTSGSTAGCAGVAPGPVGGRDLYFDPCAFSKPDPGRIGTAGRNLLLGPDLRNVNFTLSKSFQLGERTRLQFRSEFFNLFNRVQLRNPAARIYRSRGGGVDSRAGRISQSLDNSSREIQLGLKLTF
jgi:outer membrane receptor protein involved in Fe transport